jgi:hypothetical protein
MLKKMAPHRTLRRLSSKRLGLGSWRPGHSVIGGKVSRTNDSSCPSKLLCRYFDWRRTPRFRRRAMRAAQPRAARSPVKDDTLAERGAALLGTRSASVSQRHGAQGARRRHLRKPLGEPQKKKSRPTAAQVDHFRGIETGGSNVSREVIEPHYANGSPTSSIGSNPKLGGRPFPPGLWVVDVWLRMLTRPERGASADASQWHLSATFAARLPHRSPCQRCAFGCNSGPLALEAGH